MSANLLVDARQSAPINDALTAVPRIPHFVVSLVPSQRLVVCSALLQRAVPRNLFSRHIPVWAWDLPDLSHLGLAFALLFLLFSDSISFCCAIAIGSSHSISARHFFIAAYRELV
jgi:hypothetical protein